MWVRRIFYDVLNGETLRLWEASGSVRLLTQEEEARLCGLENWGCMEWREKDPEIEAAFANTDAEGNPRIVEVSVDVSGDEPQLVFTYTPIEDAPAGDDPYAIIDILTGGEA